MIPSPVTVQRTAEKRGICRNERKDMREKNSRNMITRMSSQENGAVNIVVDGAQIYLPMSELIDKDKELERLNSEKTKLESEIKRVEGKLSNAGFIAKAPEKLVNEEREKGDKYKEMLKKVLESIEAMSNM